MNLNRTEELEIKKDIKGIKKALEDIASGIVPVKPTTQAVVKDGDPFFGKLHVADKHLVALQGEYSCSVQRYEIGLMEEASELIQALSKRLRGVDRSVDNIIEEMAHTLICMRLVSYALDISPDDIQQEIYKKYSDGYNLTAMMADNKPYYVERSE